MPGTRSSWFINHQDLTKGNPTPVVYAKALDIICRCGHAVVGHVQGLGICLLCQKPVNCLKFVSLRTWIEQYRQKKLHQAQYYHSKSQRVTKRRRNAWQDGYATKDY